MRARVFAGFPPVGGKRLLSRFQGRMKARGSAGRRVRGGVDSAGRAGQMVARRSPRAGEGMRCASRGKSAAVPATVGGSPGQAATGSIPGKAARGGDPRARRPAVALIPSARRVTWARRAPCDEPVAFRRADAGPRGRRAADDASRLGRAGRRGDRAGLLVLPARRTIRSDDAAAREPARGRVRAPRPRAAACAVRQVACLGNCRRGLTAAIFRTGCWAYVFGGLGTGSGADLVAGRAAVRRVGRTASCRSARGPRR